MRYIRCVDGGIRTLVILFVVSFLVRAIISPLHAEKPNLPSDMHTYENAGKCFIKTFLEGGKKCYNIESDKGFSIYGPLFSVVMGVWILITGSDDYMLLKFPSIISDSFSVVVIYLIALELSRKNKAFYVALAYALAYMCLLSSGILGNDDSHALLFSLIAVYLALKQRYSLSSLMLGLSLLFKALPVLVLLPILWYIAQKKSIKNIRTVLDAIGYVVFDKNVIKYMVTAILVFVLVFTPFALVVGEPAILAYTLAGGYLTGYCPVNLIRMSFALPYHYLHPELPLNFASKVPDDPWNYYGTHWFSRFMRILAPLVQITTLLSYLLYILKYRMEDKKLEFVRNIALIMLFVWFLGSRVVTSLYFVWLLPYLLLIFVDKLGEKADTKQAFVGVFLILSSVVLYGLNFKWATSASVTEQVALNITILASTVGTYLLLGNYPKNVRWGITSLALVFALGEVVPSRTLNFLYPLFKSYLTEKVFGVMGYYVVYWVTSLMATILYVLLIVVVHRTFRDKYTKKQFFSQRTSGTTSPAL